MPFEVRIKGSEEVERNFERMVRELSDPDKLFRKPMFDLYAIVSERIQQKGLRTDGTPIGGYKGYAELTKAMRKAKGLQTDFIDLTFTGDMLDRGFIPGPVGPQSWGLGFLNQLEADKMELNEMRFGEIITPSEAEQKEAFESILQIIDYVIRSANQ